MPVASFDVEGRGEVFSWDKSAPLAGAGLMEPETTRRHQDSLNWTRMHAKTESPDSVLLAIERRVTELTGIPFHDRESPLQIGVTTPHSYRGTPIGTPLHHDVNARFNRVVSVIMYMTDEEHNGLLGGHTMFPCLRPWQPGAEEANEAKRKVEAAIENQDTSLSPVQRLLRWRPFSGWPSWQELRGGFPPDATMCDRLLLDFSAGRLILPHPFQVENSTDAPQRLADSETPTVVNEMCEQAFGDDPQVFFMKPRRGDAVLFLNALPEDGEMVPQTWHQGCSVKAGKKITLQKFKEVWPDGYGDEFAFTQFDRQAATSIPLDDGYGRVDDPLARLPQDDVLADGTGTPVPQQCTPDS